MVQLSSAVSSSLLSAAVVVSLASPSAAQAQLTRYNNQATWLAAVTSPTPIGFDDLADGTAVNGAYAGHNFAPVNGGNAAVMPEPASLAMMLAGLGWWGFVAQRRRAVKRGAPGGGVCQP